MENYKIDLNELFTCVADNYLFCYSSYMYSCSNKESMEKRRIYYENYRQAHEVLDKICLVCRFDFYRVLKIDRLFKKWMAKRKWDLYFVFDNHYDAIMEYIKVDS